MTTTLFEDFVNAELPLRIGTVEVTPPTAGMLPVYKGVGLLTEAKTLEDAGFAEVATSGSYNDLSDKPTIPTQYTDAMVLATGLADISLAVGGVISAADTVLGAFGKLQYQLTNFSPVLTEANFSVAKTGQPTYKVTWVLTALTQAWAWTVPNKAINFGDLPSVATTDSNTLAGTRTRILGGSGNNISGTDNIAVACTDTTMSSTVGHYAERCIKLTVPVGYSACGFTGVHNEYGNPIALVANALSDVEYSGWVNSTVAAAPWGKGYKVYGHKQRTVGIFVVAGTTAQVGLMAASTGTAASLTCSSDITVKPTTGTISIQSFTAYHELTLTGISEGNGYFTGRRVIKHTRASGTSTYAIETIGTDLIVGTFTASITAADGADVAGYASLDVSVRNTANSTKVHWVADLKSTIQYLYYVF